MLCFYPNITQSTNGSIYSFWNWNWNLVRHSKEFLNFISALQRCVDVFVYSPHITGMYRVQHWLTALFMFALNAFYFIFLSLKKVNKNPFEIMRAWCKDSLSWMMQHAFSDASNLNKTTTLFKMFIQSGVYEKLAPSTELIEIDTSNRLNIQHSTFDILFEAVAAHRCLQSISR